MFDKIAKNIFQFVCLIEIERISRYRNINIFFSNKFSVLKRNKIEEK